MTDMTTVDQGLKLDGDLMAEFLNDDWTNAGLGRFKIGNVPVFSFNPGEAEENDRISSMRATAGQTLDTYPVSGTPSLSFETDSISKNNMAMAVLSAVEDYTQEAGSLAAEAVDLILDRWVSLPAKNLTTGTLSVTGSGGTPALTVRETGSTDTADVEINLRLGLAMALTAEGAVAAEVTGDYGVIDGKQVRGGTKTHIRVLLFLDGKDRVAGAQFEFEAQQVSLKSSGDIQLIGGDPYAKLAFSGKVKTPEGASSGYTLRWDV